MRAKPIQFRGSCEGCGEDSEEARAAVDFSVSDDENDDDAAYDGILVCTTCAKRLADYLLRSAAKALSNVAEGRRYRDDRWQPKAKPKKARVAK